MTNAHVNGQLLLSGFLIINDRKEILLLYRPDHEHYETPGGKVRVEECVTPNNPSVADLREAHEELGRDIKLGPITYFGNVSFDIPGGRLAIAHKFVTSIISGTPRVNEPDTFSKYEYLPLAELEDYPISPDLRLFADRLKNI